MTTIMVNGTRKMKKDKCISCGEETLYDKEDHIDFRIGYIETAGQLCLNCYKEIYGYKKEKRKGKKNEKRTMVGI